MLYIVKYGLLHQGRNAGKIYLKTGSWGKYLVPNRIRMGMNKASQYENSHFLPVI
jgi:hypothetical protein